MRALSFDVGIINLGVCDFYFENKTGPVELKNFEVLNVSTPGLKRHDVTNVSDTLLRKLKDMYWKARDARDARDAPDACETQGENGQRIDFVLIENQPVQKNPVMKSIQMVIFTFFNMMRILNPGSVGEVRLVSASNKLKLPQQIECQEKRDEIISSAKLQAKAEKGYKYNKKLAVCMLEHFIASPLDVKNGNDFKVMLDTKKKIDDLADTFLQGFWFVRCGTW